MPHFLRPRVGCVPRHAVRRAQAGCAQICRELAALPALVAADCGRLAAPPLFGRLLLQGHRRDAVQGGSRSALGWTGADAHNNKPSGSSRVYRELGRAWHLRPQQTSCSAVVSQHSRFGREFSLAPLTKFSDCYSSSRSANPPFRCVAFSLTWLARGCCCVGTSCCLG